MLLDEDKIFFDVIEVEWNPEFFPNYMYAKRFNEQNWETNGKSHSSLIEIAEEIAENIVGTKLKYEIISDIPISEVDHEFMTGEYFMHKEGLRGYSETSHITNTRRLDREEMSNLGKALLIKMQKRRELLDSPDD